MGMHSHVRPYTQNRTIETLNFRNVSFGALNANPSTLFGPKDLGFRHTTLF